jgi:predicted RNase H-like HicB family nuclease
MSMAKRRFTVVLIPDEDGYQVVVPHYHEVTTWGKDPGEAFERAREVLEASLEEDAARGQVLPPVTPAPYVVVGEIEAEVPDDLIAATQEWLSGKVGVRKA